jgi:ABC-2 type transport system permease protein
VNLVRAEFERLFARRFVRLMLVLLVAAFGITIATTLVGSHRPTAEELSQATQRAETKWNRDQQLYQDCVDGRQPGNDEMGRAYPEDCADIRAVRVQPSDFLAGVFVFDQQIRSLIYFLIAFLVLFAFLVGASYIGADLNSGGMTNLLLWRPRRMLVLGTKLGTLLAAALGVSVVAAAVYLGAFWAIAQGTGLPGDLDPEFWGWLSLSTGRGLALVLMAAALGFAIATLGRHTAAALGVVAAYTVVWEAGARIVMEIVDTPRPDLWMLSSHVGAWMSGEMRLWDDGACSTSYRACDPSYSLTWLPALIVLLTVVGGLVGAAFAAFARRDLA